jgi:hypothetical protein
MAYPVWPASLPQNPYAYGQPAYQPKDEPVTTQMEAGPAKSRSRFTAEFDDFDFELCLSKAQLATLTEFYRTGVQRVLPFEWVRFDTGAAALYRFRRRPARAYHAGSGDFWMVKVELLLLP